jgi:hypothetical protein
MKRLTLLVLLTVFLGACQQSPTPRPVPSVAQIGQDLQCAAGDHAFEDTQAGWGFCYPATWKYFERVGDGVGVGPPHLDITLDITDVPCVQGSPVAGETPRPVCSPNAGLFGFMVISTYERGNAADLVSWMQGSLPSLPDRQAIVWGNAAEADQLGDGRRIALTPERVVILELRSGQGQLDLEGEMSARLDTWKFLF